MVRRVLELIVTGKDQASGPISSAEEAVTSLGASAAGAGQGIMTFAEHVEVGRRMMAGLSSDAGMAANSLGSFASGAGGAGIAASSARADVSVLTGAISMLGYGAGASRRGVMMFTRGIRLLSTAARSSIADLSTAGKIVLGIGAAGAVGVVALAAITAGIVKMAKRSIEADDKRVDFEEWTKDAGGHVEVLGRLREVTGNLISDLELQEDATDAITKKTKELMDADYLLTEAEARRLAFMGYERDLYQSLVERGGRTGDMYREMTSDLENVTDQAGQAATRGLDVFAESAGSFVAQGAPAYITAVGNIMDVLGRLAAMEIWQWTAGLVTLKYMAGERPSAAPTPAPYGVSGAAPRDVAVSGVIDVTVRVTGDPKLAEAGRQIGRGIQAELQRIGIE